MKTALKRLLRVDFLMVLTTICITCNGITHAQNTRPSATPSKPDLYSDGLRKWTPSVSAEVRYFDDIFAVNPVKLPDPIVPSPDGKFFFYTSWYGDLLRDCNVSELSVYAVGDLVRLLRSASSGIAVPPSPLRTVTMCHRHSAIDQPSWSDDGKTIEFWGRKNPQSQATVYRLHVASGVLEKAVDVTAPKELWAYFRQGSTVVYSLREEKEAPDDRYPIYEYTPERVWNFMTAGGRHPTYPGETFISQPGHPIWRLKSGFPEPGSVGFSVVFSPTGRYAIMERRPAKVNPTWARYDRGLSVSADPSTTPFTQFILVDLLRRTEQPIFDAPSGRATQVGGVSTKRPSAFWSGDGKKIVILNTALPLAGEKVGSEAEKMSYVISYDVESHSYDVLEPYRRPSGEEVADGKWLKPGKELLVRHVANKRLTNGTVYSYDNGKWEARQVDASVGIPDFDARVPRSTLAQGLSVKLIQSPNDPPKVVATLDGRELTLTRPDPAVARVKIAKTTSFVWKDSKGTERTSGLTLPADLPPDGQKIPLVIQIGYYQADLFRPDGPVKTAVAEQALAAAGMAVLNLDIPQPQEIQETGDRNGDVPLIMDWTDSVVAALAAAYPIDINRVGVVGFSRTGYLAHYMITFPHHVRPSAAVLADNYAGSYMEMMNFYAQGNDRVANEYYSIYGGKGFYESKNDWLERETLFNADKVQTPVLFAQNGGDGAITWNLGKIGAFRAAKRPYEYLALPGAEHQIQAPRQLEASLRATVDWMAFWLQGKLPGDKQRATHWLELRKQQEAINNDLAAKGEKFNPLPPLVSTSAQ